MTSREMISLLTKQWANVNDIKKIACCGRDSAIKIRNEITFNIEKEGKKLPNAKQKLVPMNYVIQYLNLDVDHISLMAQKELQLTKGITYDKRISG